ncbi:MAG: adenine deaminase C-terminal domain-containing protein [Candidatus Bathyarchaeia archaeon]
MSEPGFEALVDAAMGKRPFTLLLRDAMLVNVVTAETYLADIGIFGNHVAYVGDPGRRLLSGENELNLEGRYVAPGLIDTHLHVESSMVTLPRFAEAVVPRGVTTAAIDPHEVANVLGKEGVAMMLESAEGLPLRVHLLVPTCVPSLPKFETAGGKLEASDIEEMLRWPQAIGLGEVMDYEGLIRLAPRTTSIVATGARRGVVIDGHAPGLAGRELAAYAAAGVDADHEVTGVDQVVERLRLGMFVKLRKGTVTRDMTRALSSIGDRRRVLLVTDDVMPDDLVETGHLDSVVRAAIEAGYNPLEAIQAVTVNAASHLRLYDRGIIAPGKLADLIIFDSLERFHVEAVIEDGRTVAQHGKLVGSWPLRPLPARALNTVRLEPPRVEAFMIKAPVRSGLVPARVIVAEGFETRFVEEHVEVKDGLVLPGGLATITVFDRYTGLGGSAQGLIQGLGLRSGAVAATVSHDSHNLVVVGISPTDMALAAKAVIDAHGGLAVADGGRLLAALPLPVAGLMSEESLEALLPKVQAFKEAEEALGIRYLPLGGWLGISFLALPVIPHARITDRGLFDVDRQRIVPLFTGE